MMRTVIWLQTVTVFWLSRETISLRFTTYMGLIMLDRETYT